MKGSASSKSSCQSVEFLSMCSGRVAKGFGIAPESSHTLSHTLSSIISLTGFLLASYLLSAPIPPVSKNCCSAAVNSPLVSRILSESTKANRSLSFTKRDLQMLQ